MQARQSIIHYAALCCSILLFEANRFDDLSSIEEIAAATANVTIYKRCRDADNRRCRCC